MLRIAGRMWHVPGMVAVAVIVYFCVPGFRGFFGHTVATKPGAGPVNQSAPFNPKVVTYEIFGSGSAATINYLDLDAQLQKPENTALPWSLTLTTTAPVASPNIIAQSDGEAITCRITVDGVVKDERTSDGVNAQTFCLVKSA